MNYNTIPDKLKLKEMCVSRGGLINNNYRKHMWLRILEINNINYSNNILTQKNEQNYLKIIENDVNRSVINEICNTKSHM